MSVFLYPDNPTEVSLDYLRRLDAEAPGTYLGQPKLDGWRRLAIKRNGVWMWYSKPSGSGSVKSMPRDLQAEFEGLDLPSDMVYDMEWIGTRMVEHKPAHSLYVFDWYPLDCKPTFSERIIGLGSVLSESPRVKLAPLFSNPGLVDRFTEQLQNPISEGLVVRRADSKIIGHPTRCVNSPFVFKTKYRNVRNMRDLKELPA